MRRAALIVLIATVYLGCAKPQPTLEPEPEPPTVVEPEPPPERPEPEAEPEPPSSTVAPLSGGSLRIALSGARLDVETRGLLLNRWDSRTTSLLDNVEFLNPEGIAPAELLLLGEADMALVHGRQISRVERTGDYGMLRAPGWDRAFALRCDPGERWTNDPNFRRWLAETVDRIDLVEHLFEGLATPAYSLLSPHIVARWAPPMVRPFGPTSRPALDLAFDPLDPDARAIAARMKAAFAIEGMDLRLVTEPDGSTPALTLVSHQQWEDDPLASFGRLIPDDEEGARWFLRQAESAEEQARVSLVVQAEDAMLAEARLIPLLRLEAWFAFHPRLQGVTTGWAGDMSLEELWWKP